MSGSFIFVTLVFISQNCFCQIRQLTFLVEQKSSVEMKNEIIKTLSENREKLIKGGATEKALDEFPDHTEERDSNIYTTLVVKEIRKRGFKSNYIKNAAAINVNDIDSLKDTEIYFIKIGQRFKILAWPGGFKFEIALSLYNTKGDLLLEERMNPFLREIKKMFK
jgi:hypothetical protein